MIVATIDFPDERTGADHLHGFFANETEASWWVGWVSDKLGGVRLNPTYAAVANNRWTCMVCSWTTRGTKPTTIPA
jgi:hypothetical protein